MTKKKHPMTQDPNPNSISPDDSKKILELFDRLDQRDRAVYDDLEFTIKKVIEKHYPDIFNLEPEGYHQLDDRLSRHIFNIRLDINNIIFRNKIK
jgi:hypothetical protein